MKIKLLLVLTVSLITENLQAGVSTFLYEKSYGDCNIKITHVAPPGVTGVIYIRSRTNSNKSCPISKPQLRETLFEGMKVYQKYWYDAAKPKNKEFKRANSIFLGRIKNYPWISEFVVEESSKRSVWNKKTGRPEDRTTNKYINQLMMAKEVLFYFDLVLEQIGMGVSGALCEKVLINKDRLPYDAMCWLSIGR